MTLVGFRSRVCPSPCELVQEFQPLRSVDPAPQIVVGIFAQAPPELEIESLQIAIMKLGALERRNSKLERPRSADVLNVGIPPGARFLLRIGFVYDPVFSDDEHSFGPGVARVASQEFPAVEIFFLLLDQPKLSRLLRGQLSGFSAERLMHFLTLLGRDVEIVVKRTPRSRRQGHVRVVAAA